MKRDSIHLPNGIGDKVADAVCTGMGSWSFVLIQTAIVIVWIALNLWVLTHPFDPFPLILLNLVFSTQAAYASPLILMSQNRQAGKDRKRDDVEAEEVGLLLKINQEQSEMLAEYRKDFSELRGLLVRIALEHEHNEKQSERRIGRYDL